MRTWSAGWDWWAGFVRKDLHHLVKELERRTEEDTDDGDEDQQKYVVPRGHPRTIVGAVKSSLSILFLADVFFLMLNSVFL